jgi:hypothetical protein
LPGLALGVVAVLCHDLAAVFTRGGVSVWQSHSGPPAGGPPPEVAGRFLLKAVWEMACEGDNKPPLYGLCIRAAAEGLDQLLRYDAALLTVCTHAGCADRAAAGTVPAGPRLLRAGSDPRSEPRLLDVCQDPLTSGHDGERRRNPA